MTILIWQRSHRSMIKSFGLRQELRVLRAQERCRNLVHFPRAFPKDSNWSSGKRPSLLLHLVMVPFKLWHTLFKAAMFFAALFTSFLQELANSRASRRAFRAAVAASLSVLLLLALAGLSLFCPSSSLGTDQTSSSTWIVASSLLGPLGAAAGLALALPTVFFSVSAGTPCPRPPSPWTHGYFPRQWWAKELWRPHQTPASNQSKKH